MYMLAKIFALQRVHHRRYCTISGAAALGVRRTSPGCCEPLATMVRWPRAQSSTRRQRARFAGVAKSQPLHQRGVMLEGKRAPQGLAVEDRLALGLTASHLSYLLVGSLAGDSLFVSRLPVPVKISD